MHRSVLSVTALVFCVSVATAQTKTIDSLLSIIYEAKTEQQKLVAMINLCEEYQSLNRDTLDYYSFKALEVSKKVGDKKLIDLAAIAVADDYYRWGWGDSALAAIEPVLKNNSVTMPAERAVYFKAARRQALYFSSKMKLPEALDVLYRLVNEAEQYNDTIVITTNLNTIGSIALLRESPQVALGWLNKAKGFLTSDTRFDAVRAAIYVNLSEGYFLDNRLDSAVYYIEKGVQLFRVQQNLMSLALALQRQSRILLKKGNVAGAEAALKDMIEVRKSTHDGGVWVDDNISLIDFYITSHQLDKAIEFCKTMLKRGDLYEAKPEKGVLLTNNLSMRLLYYQQLARCYKLKGDTNLYQQTLEQIILAKDTLAEAREELAIAEVQTRYEVQKKENTIMQQNLTIVRKNNMLLLSLSIAVIIAVVVFFLFRDYRKKQKLKVARAIEHEKQLTVQAIANAEENERKRIAADLHDNLGAYAASIASNLDVLQSEQLGTQHATALQELNDNSQTIVAQLSDTIWALNKDSLTLTAISDRLKLFLNRLRKSYPGIEMEVEEHIGDDIELPPTQAFHLFQVIQEAVTNAIKHSGTQLLTVQVTGGEQWEIAVIDYGRGMSSTGHNGHTVSGNGLRNMKDRAGISGWHISWEGVNGGGTAVVIRSMED